MRGRLEQHDVKRLPDQQSKKLLAGKLLTIKEMAVCSDAFNFVIGPVTIQSIRLTPWASRAAKRRISGQGPSGAAFITCPGGLSPRWSVYDVFGALAPSWNRWQDVLASRRSAGQEVAKRRPFGWPARWLFGWQQQW